MCRGVEKCRDSDQGGGRLCEKEKRDAGLVSGPAIVQFSLWFGPQRTNCISSPSEKYSARRVECSV